MVPCGNFLVTCIQRKTKAMMSCLPITEHCSHQPVYSRLDTRLFQVTLKLIHGVWINTRNKFCNYFGNCLHRLINKKRRKRRLAVPSEECNTTGDLSMLWLALEREGDLTQMLLEVLYMLE